MAGANIDAKPPNSHRSKRSRGRFVLSPLATLDITPPCSMRHSAVHGENLRPIWRDSPPCLTRLSALLDTTLRLTCIKVRRRVVESKAESCLMYGGALEGRGRRVVQTSIYRSHDLLRATSRPPWRFRWTDRARSSAGPGGQPPSTWSGERIALFAATLDQGEVQFGQEGRDWPRHHVVLMLTTASRLLSLFQC